MELDPRRLRVLRAVAVCGGVVDAARLLHLTPSAVSQHLLQLEKEAGLALVDRSRRRVGLTSAGRLLADRAERIEQELAEARRELTELSGRLSGPVVIAAFPTAICHLLVPALRTLARTHPDLSPRVVQSEGPEALRDLRTGGVDLLIDEHDADNSEPAPHHHGLSVESIADDEYRIAIPAEWPVSSPSIGELATRPWIAMPPDIACGQALDRIAAEYGFTPRRAHTCLEFPAVLALVAAGFGAAVVPTLAMGDLPADSVRTLTLPVAGRRRIMAVRRASRSGPEPLTDVLVTALREVAARASLTVR